MQNIKQNKKKLLSIASFAIIILVLIIRDQAVIKKTAIIFMGLCLLGCTYISSKFPQSKQLPRQQTCSELKRQLTFNKTINNEQFDATQQAKLMRTYKKYDCEETQ